MFTWAGLRFIPAYMRKFISQKSSCTQLLFSLPPLTVHLVSRPPDLTHCKLFGLLIKVSSGVFTVFLKSEGPGKRAKSEPLYQSLHLSAYLHSFCFRRKKYISPPRENECGDTIWDSFVDLEISPSTYCCTLAISVESISDREKGFLLIVT